MRGTRPFPGQAREALDRGATSDEALLTVLWGVAQAEFERGGDRLPSNGRIHSSG